MTSLRERLLRGRTVALAGVEDDQLAGALAGLGAAVVRDRLDGPPDALLYDARTAFGSGGGDGLRAALDGAWARIREVAGGALIPAQRGKIIVIAPPAHAGQFADAARAALENLARTLSVEWARYGITTTMIAPGAATTGEQLAELACFLISEAGDYFSGCRLELGAVATC